MWCSLEELDERIKKHAIWCRDLNAPQARKFETRDLDLRHAGDGLSEADFSNRDLSGADFRGANLARACFRGTHLAGADFYGASLEEANFADAWLSRAQFSGANLRRANVSGAYLFGANLVGVEAVDADFSNAYLEQANLTEIDLSGARGLLDPTAWLRDHFEAIADGLIVYKRIGQTDYRPPAHWSIEPGSVLAETVNPNRTDDCGCGVNFATFAWCQSRYFESQLWKCRISWFDLASVVVPYNTDGKARCARLELIEPIQSTDPE